MPKNTRYVSPKSFKDIEFGIYRTDIHDFSHYMLQHMAGHQVAAMQF